MLEYVSFPGKACRSRLLETYFGEMGTKDCGKCDYCLAKARPAGVAVITELSTALLAYIGNRQIEMRELIDNVTAGTRDERIAIVREMLDKGILVRGEGLSVRRTR
jgi:ATP-dependent DNA helicase RecQ